MAYIRETCIISAVRRARLIRALGHYVYGEVQEMEYLQQLSDDVLSRLERLGYSDDVVNRLKSLRLSPPVEGIRLIDLRVALERFLEDTARLSPRYGGTKYSGNFKSPVGVRVFLENTRWITKAELEFISAFYGLLSDRDAHGGQSFLSIVPATYLCWSVADTISHRILNRPKPPRLFRGEKQRIEQELANGFVEGLRAERYEGRAFEEKFTEEVLKKVRQRLTKNDTPFLWKMVDNSSVRPGLRNRAASLLLGDRLGGDSIEQGRIVGEMTDYYEKNKSLMPWELRRAIALALANQSSNPDCFLDYISSVSSDAKSLEENLQTTDNYYEGVENALRRCLQRVDNHVVFPTASCLWEIFYVSRRCQSKDTNAIRALERRLNKTHEQRLKDFCQATIDYLKTH